MTPDCLTSPVESGLSSEKEHADLDVGELAGVAQDEVARDAPRRAFELAGAADNVEDGAPVAEMLVRGAGDRSIVDGLGIEPVAVAEVDRRVHGERDLVVEEEAGLEDRLFGSVVEQEPGCDSIASEARLVGARGGICPNDDRVAVAGHIAAKLQRIRQQLDHRSIVPARRVGSLRGNP
jgi:hypothetical protein